MSAGYSLHPTILREYDIRGIVGETLSADDVGAIGAAFATRLVAAGGASVAVGYDGRQSSPELEAALVAGLVGCGLHVIRVGVGPTPMLYFAAATLPTDGGVMITGSHNPPEYNGIKMTLKGKPFFGDDIRSLAKIAAAGDTATGEGRTEEVDLRDAYADRLAKEYKASRALRVGWDPGNGAAAEVLNRLLTRIAGHHHVINGVIDGSFPNHHPDPTVLANLQQLQTLVADEGCELGIAFDGDGDRIGVVDAQGRVLHADQLMLILAADVLAERPGAPIIADVKSSQVLFDETARLGGRPVMWKTGHSLIRAKMIEMGAPMAGEMSGHIFFADRYYGFDDALYAAVRLLAIIDCTGTSLAEYRDRMPAILNTPELRFPCAEARKFEVIEEVRARLSDAGAEVNDIDGVRVLSGDGWWLLRASNTQDVLVARCEAASEAGLAALKGEVAAQLRASGLEPPADLTS
ncbi:MAG: phosphomannomutase/phosphoglucomutase [Alphaproteobacteria bacterium]